MSGEWGFLVKRGHADHSRLGEVEYLVDLAVTSFKNHLKPAVGLEANKRLLCLERMCWAPGRVTEETAQVFLADVVEGHLSRRRAVSAADLKVAIREAVVWSAPPVVDDAQAVLALFLDTKLCGRQITVAEVLVNAFDHNMSVKGNAWGYSLPPIARRPPGEILTGDVQVTTQIRRGAPRPGTQRPTGDTPGAVPAQLSTVDRRFLQNSHLILLVAQRLRTEANLILRGDGNLAPQAGLVYPALLLALASALEYSVSPEVSGRGLFDGTRSTWAMFLDPAHRAMFPGKPGSTREQDCHRVGEYVYQIVEQMKQEVERNGGRT